MFTILKIIFSIIRCLYEIFIGFWINLLFFKNKY